MTETDIGPFWDEIGQTIVESLNGDADRTLLYIGCESACAAEVAYREHETDVEQLGSVGDVSLRILSHWETLDPQTRWTDVAYSISNGRFHVEFIYPSLGEGEDPLDQFEERSAAVFERHFEGKPMRPFTDADWARVKSGVR